MATQFIGVVVGSKPTLVTAPARTSLVLRNAVAAAPSESAILTMDDRVLCTLRPQASLDVHVEGGRTVSLRAGGGAVHVTGTISQTPPSLAADLAAWRALVSERRALAAASAHLAWEEQAAAQGLPIDADGLALHRACGRRIAKRNLRRGECAWRPRRQYRSPTCVSSEESRQASSSARRMLSSQRRAPIS